MALVACKECGVQVAQSAPSCPKCGSSRPGIKVGKLNIVRESKVTGIMYAVQVTVDGQPMGKIWNGGALTLELPAGHRQIDVRGGGLSRSTTVQIGEGQTSQYQMYFSEWGFLGGGLNFKPA